MIPEVSQHFVTFYSPGTFVAETTTEAIDTWDVDKAVTMARKIMERYNATPYGFRFSTRGRTADELDSKEIAESPMYFLGGEVLTLAEIKAKNDPADRILISNMEGNKINRVVINQNSWKWTQPLRDGDIVLPFTPKKRRTK